MEAHVASRLWRRLLRRDRPTTLDPDRADLIVVASCFDDAEACSTALARATGLTPDAPAVLRHHLRIPPQHVDTVCAIAAQDGYSPAPQVGGPAADALETVILQRMQLLDALHCAQERSRMAGLAQRHDGTADGWDALQPRPHP
ncbi:hypothetical protein IU450_30675 [Nocardia abscessus]|uniref:hypothetical protein n=1 Tax=Nocardia abscessus TaxID=120957 RepID=UPI001893B88A|nr:hypothetical protein [Nocardia abscessus]MBF6340222.1 hypothetical protein [Nocardia abscessus]